MLEERGRAGGLESAAWGGVVEGTEGSGCLLREQHEQSVEVRHPREKPAEVFLAEPSQG